MQIRNEFRADFVAYIFYLFAHLKWSIKQTDGSTGTNRVIKVCCVDMLSAFVLALRGSAILNVSC